MRGNKVNGISDGIRPSLARIISARVDGPQASRSRHGIIPAWIHCAATVISIAYGMMPSFLEMAGTHHYAIALPYLLGLLIT